MKRKSIALLAAFILVAFGFIGIARAAELYVNTDGKVKISDAAISRLNNNIVTVTLWSVNWVIYVGTDAKVTNAAGETISPWDMRQGHTLYVEGDVQSAGVGKMQIEATTLRDMSISGSGKALPEPAVLSASALGALSSAAPVSSSGVSAGISAPAASAAAIAPGASRPISATGASLRRGVSGDAVRALQNVLLSQGYLQSDAVTGFFGPVTEQAVMQLQAAHGLERVGYVGPETQKIIDTLASASANTQTKSAGAAPASAAGFLTDTLEAGMRGPEVVALQEFLQKNNLGIPNDGPVTGYYGAVTIAAVMRFQSAHNLEPVGYVGPATRALINAMVSGGAEAANNTGAANSGGQSVAAPAAVKNTAPSGGSLTQDLQPGMRGQEVVTLQEFLQKNNWGIPNDGPVTGYYGSVTKNAVTRFQEANGLEAVGIVGPQTRDIINKFLGGQ